MLNRFMTHASVAAFAATLAAGAALAEPSKQEFKMVGTWSFLSHYKEVEAPFFKKTITEASGGKIKVDIKSITELNLKGFEVVDLTRKGVYDIVAGVIAYVASKSPELEGMDLAGVNPDFDDAKNGSNAYRAIAAREFEAKYGVKLLGLFGYPSQQFWCSKPIKTLADFKGLKIRVYGSSLGDFVQGLGGVPVTIAFGEVVPALQKGVADCGITGTLPAYDAKWREVVTHVYKAGLGWAPSFVAMNMKRWNGLDKPTQEFMQQQFKTFEDKAWAGMKKDDDQGFICNTGKGGKCLSGEPGSMTLVVPSDADKKKLKEIAQNNVLASWAKRCGAKCVKEWNDTIGKTVGLTAK